MTDDLRALADRWAEDLIDRRRLGPLTVERFAAVLVDRARNRIRSGTGEAGSKGKGRGKR